MKPILSVRTLLPLLLPLLPLTTSTPLSGPFPFVPSAPPSDPSPLAPRTNPPPPGRRRNLLPAAHVPEPAQQRAAAGGAGRGERKHVLRLGRKVWGHAARERICELLWV
ncbi:hypothetical protein BS50DRAFT_620901 [Corynespora cassiicola Philippines]|uniref:Uncharacterized protein n=1 Tax=Corynespora cassiicola Philippines TaxID=1448308 RepID=A0A2T2NMM9_CORCC|nr:hypothetical protein BS50DRAFT_620901 [Corynespora cassiicola Philippines]